MESGEIYEYDYRKKVINGILVIGFFVTASMLLSLYIFYFSKLQLIEGTFIADIINFFKAEKENFTLLGLFVFAVVGGLFFIPLPMEFVFVTYLIENPNTFYVFLVYYAGIIIAYMLDLFIGYRFSRVGRKLISTQKFYEIKSMINRYGKWAVFITAATPLPGQIVAFIAGVFKYNKTKFLVQFITGLTLKLVVIISIVLVFKVYV